MARGGDSGDHAASRTVERVVSLLLALAEEARPMAVTELAEATGWPQATVHRLLTSLQATGWVEKDTITSRYKLGYGMLGPAAVALTTSALVERAQPIINRIAELGQANCLLAVLVGRQVVYLARAAPGQETSILQPGLNRPAHSSAAGKVLLAFLPGEQRERLYRGRTRLHQFTPRTIVDVAELLPVLEGVRAQGYATEDGEYREYMRSVAVPVHAVDGSVIAAITCSGRPDRMTDEHMGWLKEEMGHLADELSRQIGTVDI
jgi:IclR family transcriptional regulator, acetate operon repressor